MKRNINIRRLYSLGDYKNITIEQTIDDVPEDLMLNKDVVEALTVHLLLSIEKAHKWYYKYMEKVTKETGGSIDKQLELIEAMSEANLAHITKLLTNGHITDTEPTEENTEKEITND